MLTWPSLRLADAVTKDPLPAEEAKMLAWPSLPLPDTAASTKEPLPEQDERTADVWHFAYGANLARSVLARRDVKVLR